MYGKVLHKLDSNHNLNINTLLYCQYLSTSNQLLERVHNRPHVINNLTCMPNSTVKCMIVAPYLAVASSALLAGRQTVKHIYSAAEVFTSFMWMLRKKFFCRFSHAHSKPYCQKIFYKVSMSVSPSAPRGSTNTCPRFRIPFIVFSTQWDSA